MDTSYLDKQLHTIIAMLPYTMVIGSSNYTVTKTTIKASKKYSEYGSDSNYTFSVQCKKSDFPTIPTIGTKATVDGTTYRIIGYEMDVANVGLRLDLGGEYE